MNWLTEKFHTSKPIIAMCHLKPLPGDPGYDAEKGVLEILEAARRDLHALQDGGVDAVMFSNEASLPYLLETEAITSITMARIIGELMREIKIPFGVNVLWDPIASIDLAVATGAVFVREIFTGVYGSDFGLWNTNAGKTVRHQHRVGGKEVKLLYNIVPESAAYVSQRDPVQIARSTVFNAHPDALCVSGLTAGTEVSTSTLQQIKLAVPQTAIFANTGVNLNNVEQILSSADGAIIGTFFKKDGYIWNEVDINRVRPFMEKVRSIR